MIDQSPVVARQGDCNWEEARWDQDGTPIGVRWSRIYISPSWYMSARILYIHPHNNGPLVDARTTVSGRRSSLSVAGRHDGGQS